MATAALRDDVLLAALQAGGESRQATERLRDHVDGAVGAAAALYAETRSDDVLRVAIALLAGCDDWLERAATFVTDASLDRWAILEVAGDLCWAARRAGRSRLAELRDVDLAALDPERPTDRLLACSRLQAERFDFRFGEVLAAVDGLGPRWIDDPYIRACRAFGRLATDQLDDGIADLEVARASGSDQPRVLHVLAHGLWFADGLPGRADLTLDLCHRLLAVSPGDAIVHLRRGVALRWRGDHVQALRAFDDGIARLAPEAVDVHADFVRERTLTSAAMEASATQARLLAELRDKAEAEVREVREQLNDGVFKVVEILGLFLALAGFLATSGVALFADGPLDERLILLGSAVAGSLVFFWVLRRIVQPSAQRRAG